IRPGDPPDLRGIGVLEAEALTEEGVETDAKLKARVVHGVEAVPDRRGTEGNDTARRRADPRRVGASAEKEHRGAGAELEDVLPRPDAQVARGDGHEYVRGARARRGRSVAGTRRRGEVSEAGSQSDQV